jgi:ABC-type glycerol-3-phosphate transport system permease component
MASLIIFFPLIAIVVIFVLVWIFLMSLKPKKQYGVKSVTQKGETVKSIGERRIADYFERKNIRYVYEKEAKGKFLIFFDYKISSPDFYLLDYDVYVEYWGLVNADDRWTRENYVRNMKRKMAIYYRNNIKFISIYPRNLENLDWIFRTNFKKVTGFDLPN